MQTTVDLPDALYRKGVALAALRGATVEQFIIEAVAKAVQGDLKATSGRALFDAGNHKVKLPLIHSKRPGSLDLSNVDFDELLG